MNIVGCEYNKKKSSPTTGIFEQLLFVQLWCTIESTWMGFWGFFTCTNHRIWHAHKNPVELMGMKHGMYSDEKKSNG